jgi:hypothetical protein
VFIPEDLCLTICAHVGAITGIIRTNETYTEATETQRTQRNTALWEFARDKNIGFGKLGDYR